MKKGVKQREIIEKIDEKKKGAYKVNLVNKILAEKERD